MKLIKNSSGKVYYGLHFYSGLAQYQDSEHESPYRVFLNEDTLRKMDPSFAGKPIFVDHVDEVDPDIDELRKDADGWVLESFYNESDGKHWVKFIIVSDRGERGIRNGMRLSNAYLPKSYKHGGVWNGIPYEKQITDAEYEHLAIVKNPRYEESVILTPEEFKKYNEEQTMELKRIANSKGEKKMKLNFFRKTKVDAALDESLCVMLPKSGKVVNVTKFLNEADDEMKKKEDSESAGEKQMANMDHVVKMKDGSKMNIGDLLKKHQKMCDELEEMKKDSKETELDLETEEAEVDVEGDLHNDDEEEVESEEHKKELNDDEKHPEDAVHDDDDDSSDDKDAKKKALQLAEHEEKEIEEAKKKNIKKKNSILAREKAERLRNAHTKAFKNDNAPTLELSEDRLARGKARYGS